MMSITRTSDSTPPGWGPSARPCDHAVTDADWPLDVADAMTGRHSDSPSSLDEVDLVARDALKAMMFRRARPLRRVGRYRITRILGEGGMGVVYAGHDDQLDRPVAVKLIRAGLHDEAAQARLLREAQGLARLSHPNVVQVHEVAEHEGAVFVAMELVQGKTLREWIDHARATAQPWRAILGRLCEAGRGLEAAHAAGLIHRDFKPDNAIVGDDGRVRVLDFGLVRGAGEGSDSTSGPRRSSAETTTAEDLRVDHQALHRTLTMVGTLLGTPAYMAPEQLERRAADATADQFSFCVVCFEALCGRRPFDGQTLHALRASVLDGRITRPAGRPLPPRRVLEIIERGLSLAPEQRWPSMTTLLRALERTQQPRRFATLGALGIGLLATGAAAGTVLLNADSPPPCVVDDSALDGVWDAARRDQLQRAFATSELPFAVSSHARIDARLQQWAGQWVDAQREACEATRVTGVASQGRLDRRTRCLERHRRRFAGTIEALVEATPQVVGRAPQMLATLPDFEPCEDPGDPSDPTPKTAPIAAAEQRLARGVALLFALELGEVQAVAREVEQVGAQHGDRRLSLEARALGARARLRSGDLQGGATELLSIIQDAERARLDPLVAELRAALALGIAGRWSKPELEAMLLRQAEVWSERVEHRGARRARDLLRARVELDRAAGEHARALAGIEQLRALGDDGDALDYADLEGAILAASGRHPEARARLEQARARAAQTWGEGSWPVAVLDHDLGLSAVELGDFGAAANELRRAEDHYRAILGPHAADVMRVGFVRAKLDLDTGHIEAARSAIEQLLPAYEQALGAEHAETGEVLNALGIVRFFAGDFGASVAAYQRALAIARKARGQLDAEVGLLYSNLGESLAAGHDHDAAIAAYRRAAEIFAVTLHPDDDLHALVLKGHAESLTERGQPQLAIPMLERALSLYGDTDAEPYERADSHRALALALSAVGGQVSRARNHARHAAQLFESLGMPEELAALRPLL